MLRIMKTFLLLTGLCVSVASAYAKEPIKHIEGAFEGEPRVFFLSKSMSGYAYNITCETCQEIKVKVTPATKAFLDDKAVKLTDLAATTLKPIFMTYELETLHVTQMHFYTKLK